MTKNKRLARRICDSSLGEIRRQFEYKVAQGGGRVLFVGNFFPSSKLCSVCGIKNQSLRLSDRSWKCSTCGSCHDRDINAAVNIRNHAVSYKVVKPVKKRSLASKVVHAKEVNLTLVMLAAGALAYILHLKEEVFRQLSIKF